MMLVFIIVMNVITCPTTTVLNALVMLAVKTKPRLKTKSNVVLSCLATTDCIMGVIGQPLFIAEIVALLQREASSTNCLVIELGLELLRVLGLTSLFHLALMNVERYIAIKHPFAYITMVSGFRILCSSAIAWITALLLTVPLAIMNNSIYWTVNNITLSSCIAISIYCQVVLYFETRRHEKQLASQQVSEEGRRKFLKENKALKVTTTVVLVLLLNYAPLIVVRMLVANSVIDSLNEAYIFLYTTSFVVILNSIFNPVIYCVRIRYFRTVFVEILLRKKNAQADEFEMRVFRSLDAVAPLEQEQEKEEGQNNEQGNSDNSNNSICNGNNYKSNNGEGMNNNTDYHSDSSNPDDNNSGNNNDIDNKNNSGEENNKEYNKNNNNNNDERNNNNNDSNGDDTNNNKNNNKIDDRNTSNINSNNSDDDNNNDN